MPSSGALRAAEHIATGIRHSAALDVYDVAEIIDGQFGVNRLTCVLTSVLLAGEQHFDIHHPTLHWRDMCDALIEVEKLLEEIKR